MSDWQLWATFSVGDHLRRNAFVADLLLYDRLIVPVPPSGGPERQRWLEMGWRPELQDRLLAAIRSEHPNVLTCIPWDAQANQQWQNRYQAARGAAFDIGIIHERTKEMDLRGMSPGPGFDFDELARRGGRPEEVDSLAHFTTRMLLRDMTTLRTDSEVMLGVPPVDVTTIPAFGSFRDFQAHGAVTAGQTSRHDLAFVGARLLVPHDPEIPHMDLVKRAAEFAQSPDMRAHRQAYHRWRHGVLLSGREVRDAEAELEAAIQDCARALRRLRWRFRSRFALAVLGVGVGVATVVGAPAALGAAGAFIGFGQWATGEGAARAVEPPPGELAFAAMFHDARRHLGWST